jgi:hypothetical protein
VTTILDAMLSQTAVHWAVAGADGYGGRTFADPVEIAVRWQDEQKLFTNAAGREVVSAAVVYMIETLATGAYLMLGTLDDLASDDEGPLTHATAYEIGSMSSSPSMDATITLRKAYLARGG